MAKKPSEQSPGFEQSIARLEEIIRETDSPSTELEEVISLVEEGTKLIRHCKGILKQAGLRIETLENPEEESPRATASPDQHDESDGPTTFSLS